MPELRHVLVIDPQARRRVQLQHILTSVGAYQVEAFADWPTDFASLSSPNTLCLVAAEHKNNRPDTAVRLCFFDSRKGVSGSEDVILGADYQSWPGICQVLEHWWLMAENQQSK